jgi:hypothetical protein
MRTGDVTVHPLADGVQPMPPSVLYPDVPMAVWQGLDGAVDHILMGPPRRELRGAAFVTALLRRDESLADETAAIDVARDLAHELAGRPPENPTN